MNTGKMVFTLYPISCNYFSTIIYTSFSYKVNNHFVYIKRNSGKERKRKMLDNNITKIQRVNSNKGKQLAPSSSLAQYAYAYTPT